MSVKIIKLKENEIWPLLNILNEVCNGIFVDNFTKTIGENRNVVLTLMDKITEEENNEEAILDLSDSELNILKNSFDEVFKQIDEWEFQTRVGVSIPAAMQIQNKMNVSRQPFVHQTCPRTNDSEHTPS